MKDSDLPVENILEYSEFGTTTVKQARHQEGVTVFVETQLSLQVARVLL